MINNALAKKRIIAAVATALGRMDSIPAEIQGNEEHTDENEKNNVYYTGSGHCGNLCRAGICL